MADTTPESVQEPLDIASSILLAHASRMQEIANQSFESSKTLLSDNSESIRKLSGIRLAVLEHTLKKLGIEDTLPTQESVSVVT
jgi:hypothetical protein